MWSFIHGKEPNKLIEAQIHVMDKIYIHKNKNTE